ncbi:MAG: tRNA 4-thiouridine(8) synthase ThiI [Clostridia bacterium]|nr:tRNA 4-thiouridine(8) synthase ThiI [Clostridia bacterium]
MDKVIIIRFCEIGLKGKNRRYFENMLISNIKQSLKDIDYTFLELHNRYVISDFDEMDFDIICDKLKKIAGIHNFSVASVAKNDIDDIEKTVLSVVAEKQGTFKVETNRAEKNFPMISTEVSRYLGGKILANYAKNLKVNVKNPDFIVNVDIREDGQTFIFTDSIKGIGGMPVGSAGRGLLLISGGIDSPVAGYLTAKRGMRIDALHFQSFPYTGEAAKQKVIDLAKIVSEYNGGRLNLHVVSFTKIQEAIHENCPESFMITMMRRFMMRIAERLSKRIGAQAIITGESLGQVASQTIESITSSNSVVTMPVLRPLIMMDKIDIIDISEKIGTYETSILPYEDCCTVFLPKFPAIKPDLNKVLDAESKLDVDALINEAMADIEIIRL